jgi:hypothetical protein
MSTATDMVKGERVTLPFGPGRIVGPFGESLVMVKMDQGPRWVFAVPVYEITR